MIKKTFPRLLISAFALCFCLNLTTVTAITQEMRNEQGFVSIGPRGVICRIDRERNIVEKLWPDGRLMFEIGARGRPADGDEPMHFVDPVAVVQDYLSRIFVLDGEKVYLFNYLGSFEDRVGNGFLNSPVGLHVKGGKAVIEEWDGRCIEVDDNRKSIIHPPGWIKRKDKKSDPVYCFKSGEACPIRKWGSQGSGDGEFNYPMGIAIAPDGSVYVADTWNHRVQQFTPLGQFIRTWGSRSRLDGLFDIPRGIAIAADGSVYVSENGTTRIQQFSPSGQFIRKWGDWGEGDGEFKWPDNIDVGPDGSVYVADEGNDRIQQFSPSGQFIRKWISSGCHDCGNDLYEGPTGIGVSPDGSVFVVDGYHDCVRQFTDSGQLIGKWGSQGTADGELKYPHGIDASLDGSVFVADQGNYRIQQFSASGQFIRKWGGPGQGDGEFYCAEDVAVSPDGSVYVVESGNHRIQQFKVGEYKAVGKTVIVFGSIVGGDSATLNLLNVRIDGKDCEGIEFYATLTPGEKGNYRFTGFPFNAKYSLTVSGFDPAKFKVKPAVISGKAVKKKNRIKKFTLLPL